MPGQQESSIIHYAHTTLVVLVPGMGDDIQAIKAGILEIADIFVINKADRDGAHQLVRDIGMMLDMPGHALRGWKPPIVSLGNVCDSDSFRGQVKELVEEVRSHYDHLVSSGGMAERRRSQARTIIEEAIRNDILEPILEDLEESGEMDRVVSGLLNRESDPHAMAEKIARRYLKGEAFKE